MSATNSMTEEELSSRNDQTLKRSADRCEDANCSTPEHRWKGQILLPLYRFENAKKSPAPSDIVTKELDLCKFLDGFNGFTQKLYFCPKTYPPITNEDNTHQKESKLNAIDTLIKTEAKKSGMLLTISDSSTGSGKKFYRAYVCGHCNSNQIRHKARKNAKSEGNGETDVENSASAGSQKDGAGLTEKPCPFNFRVRSDSVGFYVTLWGSCGISYHQGHPKVPLDSSPKQKSSSTQAAVDNATHNVTNATAVNDVFQPLFDELTELVEQCPERAAEVERLLKDLIADLRRTVAAKGTATTPSN